MRRQIATWCRRDIRRSWLSRVVRATAALVVATLACGLTPGVWGQAQSASSHVAREAVSTLREAAQSDEANPFLSFLPAEVQAEWDDWYRRIADVAASRLGGGATGIYEEMEASNMTGLNDTTATAEALPVTMPGELLLVRGQVRTEEVELGELLDGGVDVGGSLPTSLALASLGFTVSDRFVGDGLIGDGAFGSAGTGSGDFDFFRLVGLADQVLSVFVETPEPFLGLDPFVAIASEDGVVLAFADVILEGGFFVSGDATLSVRLPSGGDYFIVVGGSDDFSGFLPSDLFDAGSGPGVGTEGDYRLHVALGSESGSSRDVYAFDLEAGDVFAATLREGEKHRVGLLAPNGEELVSSGFDLSGLYPLASPLPSGGEASIAFLAPEAGRFYLAIESMSEFVDPTYGVEMGLFPVAASATRASGVQGLFIDFDGAEVDRNAFFSLPGEPDLVSLSGLSSFLAGWGLGSGEESTVIDAVMVSVERQLEETVARLGGNGDFGVSGVAGEFGIEIRNSRDHQQKAGDTRVVVGGTIAELRIQTIGIAEAIDPGNFEHTKTAVVLLDLLSAEASNPNSLNGVELAGGVEFVDLVGVAVGRIVAHEAGHLFGNFHTERDVGPASIMDSGGRLGLLLGLGDDGVFGTNDDPVVMLARDEYSRREPFRGFEETLEVVSFGLPVGDGAALRVTPSTLAFGSVSPGSSVVHPVTVTNDGAEPVVVLAEIGSRSGLGSGTGFSVNAVAPVVLEPGQVMVWMVTFSPDLAEAYDGQLSIIASDRPDLSRSVTLSGVGGEGILSIGGIALPVELPAIVYGPLVQTTQSLTVTNVGTAPLHLVWEIRGPRADRFSVAAATARATGLSGEVTGRGVRLQPLESLVLELTFDPHGAVGEANASLFLADLFGAAEPLVLPMHGRSDGPAVSIEPRPYVFGALRADGATGRRVFRLRNEGTLPMQISSATLRSGTPLAFELTPPALPMQLQPQQQIGVDVVFRPTDAVTYEGFLEIASDDPDEPIAVVEMLGFGLLPMIEVSPQTIDVGQIPAGTEVVRILRVDNVGGATLRGSFELIDLGDGGTWSVSPPPGLVSFPPETYLEFAVTFVASASGAGGLGGFAELRFMTDDRDRPLVIVPLRSGSVLAIPAMRPLGLVLLALVLVFCGLRWIRI